VRPAKSSITLEKITHRNLHNVFPTFSFPTVGSTVKENYGAPP
jgi:hypothetical protein